MTGVMRKPDLNMEFKLTILESEKESNEDLIRRVEGGEEIGLDESEMEDHLEWFREELSSINRWMDDIRMKNDVTLSREDLDFRREILDREIESHEQILEMDDSLTERDIKDIKDNIRKIGEWKRELRRSKQAFV